MKTANDYYIEYLKSHPPCNKIEVEKSDIYKSLEQAFNDTLNIYQKK